MTVNIDEELARLDAEVKKLTLIKERRNAVAALTNELFPVANSVVNVGAPKALPVVIHSIRSIKPPNKRELIAEFARDYLKANGAKTTRDLVAAIEGTGQAGLLADRKNKVVAVSQALGDLKDVFGTDRVRGWFLLETEPKVESTSSVTKIFIENDGVKGLFATSDDSK